MLKELTEKMCSSIRYIDANQRSHTQCTCTVSQYVTTLIYVCMYLGFVNRDSVKCPESVIMVMYCMLPISMGHLGG